MNESFRSIILELQIFIVTFFGIISMIQDTLWSYDRGFSTSKRGNFPTNSVHWTAIFMQNCVLIQRMPSYLHETDHHGRSIQNHLNIVWFVEKQINDDIMKKRPQQNRQINLKNRPTNKTWNSRGVLKTNLCMRISASTIFSC